MSVEGVVKALAGLAARSGVPSLAGHFANVLDLGETRVAFATDGVGTKILLAVAPEHFRAVAIDCAAMNANDVLCVGARPVALVDYLACETADGLEPYAEAIADGFAEAADRGAGHVVGGEVAVLPGIIAPRDDGLPGLDLAAAVIGVVDGEVLDGRSGRPGDAVVGVASSGVHSNGFTSLRRLLVETGTALDAPAPWGGDSVRDEVLRPTMLYPGLVSALAGVGVEVRALAHMTGGGVTNLCRALPAAGAVLDGWPDLPPVFAWIDDHLGAAAAYETFNMGVGMCAVVARGGAAPPGGGGAPPPPAGYQASVIGELTDSVAPGEVELRLGTETLRGVRSGLRPL